MHIDTQYHKCNYNVHTVYKAKTTSPTTTTMTTTCTKRKLQLHYGMAWYHFRIAVQAIDSFSSIIRPSLFPNYEHIYQPTPKFIVAITIMIVIQFQLGKRKVVE